MRENKKSNSSTDSLLELYSNLLSEVWKIASELIGEAILELLFTGAIRKMGDKYSFLTSLKVSEEGISTDELTAACRSMAPAEIHRAFQSFITCLFDLFSALAEGVVSRELFPRVFPKVREAERLVDQK